MTIKLVPDHKGNIAYVSKIAGSNGLYGNGERFVAGSNDFRTWNDYPTPEAAAEAWNAGATYNPDTHVVVPKELNETMTEAIVTFACGPWRDGSPFVEKAYKNAPILYDKLINAAQEKSE